MNLPHQPNKQKSRINGIRGLDNCKAVLSGYLGLPSTVVASAVDYVKKLDDSRLYILDPVGDDGKVFVKKGIRSSIRDIPLPRADFVILHEELSWLSGQDVNNYSATFQRLSPPKRPKSGLCNWPGRKPTDC